MIDLYTLLADRPELLALAVALVGITFSRLHVTILPVVRLSIRVLLLLAFTYLLFKARQVPYVVAAVQSDAFTRFLGDGLKAGWWLWAAAVSSTTLRTFAFRESQITGQRLFRDLCTAGIYLFAVIGLITFVLNLPVQGILVTSGAIAVVLGLALQSSLSDVFYGVVLSLGKPYSAGDWISLDNGIEGKVLEINWRATHLLTDRQDVVIVPNNVVGKSKIINASFPSRVHGTTITVLLAPGTSPGVARQLLLDATLGSPLVLPVPAPVIVIKTMSAEAIAAEITFFTSEVGASNDSQNQVYEKIYRALGVAGIGLGARNVPAPRDPVPPAMGEAERLIAFTPVFAFLTATDRAAVAAELVRETYEPGKTVLERGVTAQAMFVVGAGVMSLAGELDIEFTRMSATDHFGAGGLLGAGPSPAKVTALTRAVVFRLENKDFARLIEERPGFAHDLNRELAARQAIVHTAAAATNGKDSADEGLVNWLSLHLRRAWQLAAADEDGAG